MRKLIYSLLLLIAFFATAIYASTNSRIPNNVVPGDYQNITVYKISSENDSTASYSSRSALYYPMDGTVVIGDSHYEIKSNPNFNEKKESSSEFRYKVGNYYTNLD